MARKVPGPPPAAQKDWAYFLDFDGTLLDLAATPDTIRVDSALPLLLTALHQASAGAVALISGRALADLDLRISLPKLPKAGQHGLERRDATGRLWLHASPPLARQTIRDALAPLLERHRGLILEDKGLTLALHYRQEPEMASYVHQLMRRLVAEVGEELVVQEGKCIVEVKPAGVDKGTAVAEYLAEPPFHGRRPVFIGDDKNDEYGFAAVNAHGGISIGVGAGSARARYRLPDVAAVRAWLAGAMEDRS
ncbi:MAG TPA: trehalose-phosphatase [Azonexus sp.]|nr:trehalose-phosphatase [Azonexus sp.]